MTSKELNQLLLDRFPELTEKFNDETSWQDGLDTGSFIVFEDAFMPFLEVNVEQKNEDMINWIYNFIEELVNIDDEYVENVVYVAILENIGSFVEKDLFSKYLKGKSLLIYNENYSNL